MVMLGITPGLPAFPLFALAALLGFVAWIVPRKRAEIEARKAAQAEAEDVRVQEESRDSVKESLKTAEIELSLGKQLAAELLTSRNELAARVGKMRRKFARQYGFVVPEIKLSDSLILSPKAYEIRIHGTTIASSELRMGEVLVITGDTGKPDVPGDPVREPAFGMNAMWVSESYAAEVRREGFTPVDIVSVLLTHLSETIRNNLPSLLSYKDMRALLDRLDPEYKRLIDDICPAQISYSGLQGVLKAAAGRARLDPQPASHRSKPIAEIAPHVRRSEQGGRNMCACAWAQQDLRRNLTEGSALKVLAAWAPAGISPSTRRSSVTPRAR